MHAWWEALSVFEKVLWIIAVPSSLLTLLQVLLEVFGFAGDTDTDADMSGIGGDIDVDVDMDADGDFDADHGDHGAGMKVFTVRGLIIFFTAFSWIGLAGVSSGLAAVLASLIAATVGVAFMFLFAWIFYTLNRFTEEGNVRTKNALYKTGDVYLRIPGERTGAGKVTVLIQGHLRELNAFTDGEEIPTGARIQVLDIIDSETVLVGREK